MFHLKDPGVLIFIQKMLIRDICLITIVYPILIHVYKIYINVYIYVYS